MNNNDIFWLSLPNLRQIIGNIMTLFAAADDDIDDIDGVVTSLGSRVSTLESSVLNPSASTISVSHGLQDSSNGNILDSSGNSVDTETLYQKI